METIKFRVRNSKTGAVEGYEELTKDGWRYTDASVGIEVSYGVKKEISDAMPREQFSTFYEKGTGVELYVGDKISVADPANKAHKYEGTIVFHLGCFSLKISKGTSLMYDIGSTPPLYEFAGFKRI